MFSWPSLGSRIEPSDVAVIISPKAGVIGTLHVDGHASKLRLFVPDRQIQNQLAMMLAKTTLLLIGTMNIFTDFSFF